MRQAETSPTSRASVFDDPRRARGFFEALVADNIGIGRPEQVSMVLHASSEDQPATATNRSDALR